MPQLKIHLLGPPQIFLDNMALDLGHHKPMALLAYLAITGQPHTRAALAAMLWPEYGQARAYLRNNLSIIRSALGEGYGRWVHIDRKTIGWREEADAWLDVVEFRQHLEEWRRHDHLPQSLCAHCISHLTTAVKLYRDDFLAGFTLRDSPPFDEWTFFQREELRRDLAGILSILTHHHNRQGEFDTAIAHARRWLRLDPLQEQVHHCLMQLYANSGLLSQALRQYEVCVQLLEKELGAVPGGELQTLYQKLRSQRHIAQASPPTPTDEASTNLPAFLTPLIGRARERREIHALLQRPSVRLVTLTGAGGVGKTRLAQQVATDLMDEFADGVYEISLAPVRDPSSIPGEIAQTLGVHNAPNLSLLESLRTALKYKQMVLLLDNFEHLMAAAPMVTALLESCPHLKILTTSRTALRVQGEHEFTVHPLAIPPLESGQTIESVVQYAAVQLFLARAQAVKTDFALDPTEVDAVVQICVRLDGLPLAIELAAARLKLFSLPLLQRQLAERSSLRLLHSRAHDRPTRHRTLRRTIAWSYDLLNAQEQAFLRTAAIFAGGFMLEAAMALWTDADSATQRVERALRWREPHTNSVDSSECAEIAAIKVTDDVLEIVEALVDKSLICCVSMPDGTPRFMLLETIRTFGLDLLDKHGEREDVQYRHASYFRALAVEAEPQLYGAAEAKWLQRLELEYKNVRAALDWAISAHRGEMAMSLASALHPFWLRTRYRAEAYALFEQILPFADAEPASSVHARFLAVVALETHVRYGDVAAEKLYQRCLHVSRAVGDKQHIAFALNKLGGIAFRRGDYATWAANLRVSEPLKLEIDDHYHYVLVQGFTARELAELGRYAGARNLATEALAAQRALGDQWGMAATLGNCSMVALLLGMVDEARLWADEGLVLAQALGSENLIASSQYGLGCVLIEQGNYLRATCLLRGALEIRWKNTNRLDQIKALEGFVRLFVAQRQYPQALRLAAAVTRQRAEAGWVLPPVLRKQFDRLVHVAQTELGEVGSSIWAAGEAMTLDEAVNYALDR